MNQIKTTSWHWMYANRPKKILHYEKTISICAYFWRVVFGILATITLMITAPSVLVWGIYHLTSLIQFGQYAFVYDQSIIAFISFVLGTMVFTLGWVAAGVFGTAFAIAGIITGIEYWLKNRENKPYDNILSTYISAKKNKWCPMLEINREDG